MNSVETTISLIWIFLIFVLPILGVIGIIIEHLKNLDAVAIPSFGKFEAIKQDENISLDLSTGKRILLPPVININFTPASALVKSFDSKK